MENFRVRLFFKNEPDAVLYWQKVLPTLENVDLRDIRSEIEADKALVKEITERKKIRKETIQSRLDILKALKLTNLDEFKNLQRLERRNEHLFIDAW